MAAFLLTGCSSSIKTSQKSYKINLYNGPSIPISEKDIFKKFGLSSKQFGYVVYDLEKKKIISKYNSSKLFIPGSVSKVVIAIAALNVLGGDFRFKTQLAYKGKIDAGVLKGDLYIKGFGDPLLQISDLMNFVEVLKKYGIKKIEGKLFYDQSYLINTLQIDPVGGSTSYFNPGISALSVDYNRQIAHWFHLKETINLFLVPKLSSCQIGYSSRTNLETGFNYERKVKPDVWTLSSKYLPPKGVKSLPVKKPALFTALMFKKIARMNNINIPVIEEGVMSSDCKVMFTHRGLPLVLIVKHLLRKSKNMVAELLLLATVKKLTGKKYSLKNASVVISNWFQKNMPNVDWQGFKILNGSGLSSHTRVSSLQIMKILEYGSKKMYSGNSIISLLPISGWKGTLFSRLNYPNSAFHVWAKTGTMHYVSGLAGFFFTNSGKRMLFSLLTSDFKRRKIIDSIKSPKRLKALKSVHKWIANSRNVQNLIISKWILEL